MGLILSGVFFLVCTVFLVAKAVIMWRGPKSEAELRTAMAVRRSQPGFEGGKARAIAVQAMITLFIFIMIVSAIAAGAEDGNFSHSKWEWVFGGSAAAAVLCFPLRLAVILFNRPRFVVPPHLRGELGVMASRRRQQAKEAP